MRNHALRVDRKLAVGFNYGQDSTHYAVNREYLRDHGAEVEDDVSDDDFPSIVRSALKRASTGASQEFPARVVVDISCFNRTRLATIVWELKSLQEKKPISVDFVYVLAEYEPPDVDYFPNTHVGPVHEEFSGWSKAAMCPTAAIVGLGYEQGQALGAVEYLQAFPVWCFFPRSPIRSYEAVVDKANRLLLGELPSRRLLWYEVQRPLSLLTAIDGVIRGLAPDHNVVVVPFGPKIFVLASLLASLRWPEVAVWRVSQGKGIKPKERRGSKHLALLRATSVSGREESE
jgi:hypothetical protein